MLSGLGIIDEAQLPDMTVGECDQQLLRLRTNLFGPELDATSRCPHCHEAVEITLTAPVFESYEVPRTLFVVEDGPYLVECRIPLNRDLAALAHLGRPPTAHDLLARCVVRVGTDGRVIPVSELPEAIGAAVLNAIAREDPGAEVALTLSCPTCNGQWADVLDIREFLWAELSDWVYELLAEITQLAGAYGWSEQDILAMSDWRRRYYLQSVPS